MKLGWIGMVAAVLYATVTDGRADAHFVDVAAQVGVDFVHANGAQGKRYLPETYGAGAAFLDSDGDGWLDLYLVNGGRIPGLSTVPIAANELYRNQGDGFFTPVGQQVGVADTTYGMGASVGDYDNDGDSDLYVTNFGANRLYRNRGDGTFVDASAGVDDAGWGTSSAFADVDMDGDLDLYVGNYVEYPVDDPLVCRVGNSDERLYCDPRKFGGQVDRLYINGGAESGWTFVDRSREMGLENTQGKELGVIFGDYDEDGDTDLYLANDMTPNMLYRNDGTRFVETGLASGTSLNDEGVIEAGMGVDMADADGDGRLDLFVTNFQWESNTFYRNLGHGFFVDATVSSGINKASMAYLGFGTGFLDFDSDGDLDLFVANGHVYDNIEKVDHASTHAQRNQLLENIGGGRFVDKVDSGPGMELLQVSRGAAFADYDNDGDVDIAVNNSADHVALLRNDNSKKTHWLGVELRGVKNNRDGVGARVEVVVAGRRIMREVRASGSYLSAHDLRLLFGLGQDTIAERVMVQWPGGATQVVENALGNQYLIIEENVGP
ncbi:MAG: hypothetical protein ACI906_001293 [Candidatus Latescibacterota bacterium]|jgi:hypothetical protein